MLVPWQGAAPLAELVASGRLAGADPLVGPAGGGRPAVALHMP